jgi:hypothetical protein
MEHCLKLHGRELLYQLMEEETSDRGEARGIAQSEADVDAVRRLLRSLETAKQIGENACSQRGVRS